MNLQDSIVYANGEFTRYADARFGILTHGLQYGTGCFEGVRGFWSDKNDELYLLHLRAHFERLTISAKMLLMRVPHSVDELCVITAELCRRNGFRRDVYIRPCIFTSEEDVGVRLHDVRTTFAIAAVPFDSSEQIRSLHAGVASWRRIDDSMAPPRAKITGIYVNSALAKSEAVMSGYDCAIMLSTDGHVAEGATENVFIVRGGKLVTPDASQNILEGCTRRSILGLARSEGIDVVERAIDRSELYAAEELFLVGTATGVAAVVSVDRRVVGNGEPGPVTQLLRERYERAVRGEDARCAHWLLPVYAPALSRI